VARRARASAQSARRRSSRRPPWRRRNRAAIGRPQQKFVGQSVSRAPHLLGGEAVHGVGLVAGAHHQRREGQFHALRRVAFEDVAVERIEGEEILIELAVRPDLRKRSAFRRLRIDVIEMPKIGRVGEVAERGQAVGFDRIVGARAA
jgi:hypothetical protein